MRLRPRGCNEGSFVLDDIADNAQVYLDGNMQERVIEADTDKGYVIVHVYENGRPKIVHFEIEEKKLFGKVQIKDKRTGLYVG